MTEQFWKRKSLAEMNREAARLGMTHTHFENPHGWTAAHHKSSAADLAQYAGYTSAEHEPETNPDLIQRGYHLTRHTCIISEFIQQTITNMRYW